MTRQFDRRTWERLARMLRLIRDIEDQDAAAAMLRFTVCDVCMSVFLGSAWCHDQRTAEIR